MRCAYSGLFHTHTLMDVGVVCVAAGGGQWFRVVLVSAALCSCEVLMQTFYCGPQLTSLKTNLSPEPPQRCECEADCTSLCHPVLHNDDNSLDP